MFFVGANELFSFDESEIASKLPVLPGGSTEITVTITGAHRFPQGVESSENLSYDPEAPWGLTGSIHFRYSTGVSGSSMCRKATMAIDVTVVPSLLCENYEIIELARYMLCCLFFCFLFVVFVVVVVVVVVLFCFVLFLFFVFLTF